MSLSSTQVGTISSAFYFASALSAFPAGFIVDRYGVKKGMLSWLALTSFPIFALSFFHSNYYIVLIIVGISGLGYGMGNPVASKGLFIWFEKKTRGTVFGIRQSTVTAGGSLAGVLLVYISQESGPFVALRLVFCLIMFMTIVTSILYPTPSEGKIFKFKNEEKHERAMKHSLGGLLKNRGLMNISLITAMLGVVQGVTATFFLLYVSEHLNYSLITAGSLFTVLMISGAAGRIFWGVISDYLFDGRREPILTIISVISFLVITILAFWSNNWPHTLFVLLVIVLGVSTWGWNSIVFVIITEISDSTRTGISVGVSTTFGWLDISLGPTVFGSITDHFGYLYAWLCISVFAAISSLLCFLMPKLINPSFIPNDSIAC